MSEDGQIGINRRKALGLLLGGAAQFGMARGALAEGLIASPLPVPRPDGLYKLSLPSSETLIQSAGLTGHVSFAVADAATGESLETRDPLMRLPPASVAKTVTSLYALHHLGPEYRFATRVLHTGSVVDGVVDGDLILLGGGDPTLDTDALAELAQQVVAVGITKISGRFLVDDSALPRINEIDHEQTEYAGYNPTISGLNLNYNRVHFEWHRQGESYSLKMDARAENYAPDVRISHMQLSSRDLPVFDHEPGQGHDEWTVARSALGNGGSRWLPVRLPALYVAEVFQLLAGSAGLHLPQGQRGTVPDGATEVTRIESAPLATVVRDMLKYSTNLTAEVIGLTASQARGLSPISLAASAEAMNLWAHETLGMRHIAFVDHSGLGAESQVSTADLVTMLTAPGVEAHLLPLLKHIPMKDTKGNVVADHPLTVVAKTGTLDFVSNLAGYVDLPDGRRLAFAVFAADVPARDAAKAQGFEIPKGARTFNGRAKDLQQRLIQRWGAYYAV